MVTSLPLERMREQTSMAATPNRWPGPMVSSHSGDGRGRVDEDRVPPVALLSLLEGAKGLINGEGLRIEDLLVVVG